MIEVPRRGRRAPVRPSLPRLALVGRLGAAAVGLVAVGLVVIGLVVIGVGARPAAAETGYVLPAAGNLRTAITSANLPVTGITAQVVDLGDQLELRGVPATDVVVLGYQDEPFVRTGPDGVFVNARSPSGAGDDGFDALIVDPDPAAAPQWVSTGGAGVLRWHDHRAHWMGLDDPPVVQEDPTRAHLVIDRWVVRVVAGDQVGEVVGDLRFEPAASPVPWLVLGMALTAAFGLLAALGHRGPAVRAAAIALSASAAVLVAGWVAAGDASPRQVGGVIVPTVVGVGLLLVTAARAGRGPVLGWWLVGAGAGVAAVFVPTAPLVLSAPFASQIPTALAPVISRSAAAGVAGSAGGLVIAILAGALAVRPGTRPNRPARRPRLLPVDTRGVRRVRGRS